MTHTMKFAIALVAITSLAGCMSKEEREMKARRQFFLDSLAIERGVPTKAVRKEQEAVDKEANKSDSEKLAERLFQQQLILNGMPRKHY